MPNDPLEYFLLRPVRAAKVSEISETTAASSVAAEERVNFHIGNPVQDERLFALFRRLALGIDPHRRDLDGYSLEQLLGELELERKDLPKLQFLDALIRKSAPYMPRGGYQRSNPGELVTLFAEWLTQKQPEPLSYDLGKESGIREVILATGGVQESLRIFFLALAQYMVHLPARVLLWSHLLPSHVRAIGEFQFRDMPQDEHGALAAVRSTFAEGSPCPTFLILGTTTKEETRRALRQLALEHPLVILETNNAPNHLSLAREAGMMRRVVRFLSPAIFFPRLERLSTVFVAGNHDLINILEVAHFQLKGTPSASEAELLTFILTEARPEGAAGGDHLDGALLPDQSGGKLPTRHTEAIRARINSLLASRTESATRIMTRAAVKEDGLLQRSQAVFARRFPGHDAFAGRDYPELCDEVLASAAQESWQEELTTALLTQFVNHHPEYSFRHCVVVSGSSRTALGLLGSHCGIEEVIIPDLSWTYEHCFRTVTTVPLTETYALDVPRLIETVQRKIADNPAWNLTGAVALNNPHNATGQTFDQDDIRRLLCWLLEHRVTVIDDLAYQNVAASPDLSGPLTLRQMADDLLRNGQISGEQAECLITVHSVSKTDSLAGSRLAIAEIRNERLLARFRQVTASILPNVGAIFLSYLFYRRPVDDVRHYWKLRNSIFDTRMHALEEAVENIPAARNRYGITIRRPTGSMYPLMVISRLPAGLSLDWLSAGLARQGIGLLPLSAFARTEDGFETGRKTFRLTLGGSDSADRLLPKTRRVLIDLNRMIADEESRYNRRVPSGRTGRSGSPAVHTEVAARWDALLQKVTQECAAAARTHRERTFGLTGRAPEVNSFLDRSLPERLQTVRQRFADRAAHVADLLAFTRTDGGKELVRVLEREFYKDHLTSRQQRFQSRPYDRTVHPTQMYSLRAEMLWDSAIESILAHSDTPGTLPKQIARALFREYAGMDVAIGSADEGDELLCDLDRLIAAEDFLSIHGEASSPSFLSYWGDWDGSTRPSGQGHRLVATILVANVERLARLLRMLYDQNRSLAIDPALLRDMEQLPVRSSRFRKLLDEITILTHQLERRYKGLLPFHITPSRLRRVGMQLHLARDPLTTLWQHNDRLERRMLALREERKRALQYYFSLNKQLRKALHSHLPSLRSSLGNPDLAIRAASYRDLLQRFVITPRIHQNMVTAQDPFAIDTTVHNIMEINEISGASGNPGMILALQISMSTEPEALITLDRKTRAQRDNVFRGRPDLELPGVWLIPLFEDLNAVTAIPRYLDKIWEYAVQSRRLSQEVSARFREMVCEVFIAGSDLSQQVGQTAGAMIFREAKYQIVRWLADRGLVSDVRVKMGCGEPMQRQGGYYAPASGRPAFIRSRENDARLARHVRESTRRSTRYATTPLMGVFSGGDLRTFQSAVSEQLRSLPVKEYADLLYHVRAAQYFHSHELSRAAEPFVETRLKFSARGEQEIERLTIGRRDPLFEEFSKSATENFRTIVYGREEDVVGIHLISYFIARTTPSLRDRPTFRPGKGVAESQGQLIIGRIAETIPLAKHGSLLRAIAHNQAQTFLLGINQLTTGLFRALDTFAQTQFVEGKGEYLIADRVLPNLPVYEMLHTLRLYQDMDLTYLKQMERAFPAGNSCFTVLREDLDSLRRYVGPLQKELIRRHGIAVADFFEGDRFIADLLPTLRPDLAVLMQPDLFNRSYDLLEGQIDGPVDENWKGEMCRLLAMPEEVALWRGRAWELLERPVYGRLESFVELALALSSLPGRLDQRESEGRASLTRRLRGQPAMQEFLTSTQDDSMREFLAAAFEYLSGLSRNRMEVPTSVIKALKDIEKIIGIEEQALSTREQDLLRFFLLKIARLCGENG